MGTAILGDNLTSVGLVQWRKSRWDSLVSFSSGYEDGWVNPRAQMDFILHELETSEKRSGSALKVLSSSMSYFDPNLTYETYPWLIVIVFYYVHGRKVSIRAKHRPILSRSNAHCDQHPSLNAISLLIHALQMVQIVLDELDPPLYVDAAHVQQ